ncbi:dynamin family protein [Thalassobacillus sp. CUG 92003]|uniref:dynamin family protein n=1 Tax=Thalassobacillus sp. CUG 92003 TaxID=2736641 RepID=UPI0015E7377F|nr:dynamin family protein [Thalassobacillus sp. CUG 92003]
MNTTVTKPGTDEQINQLEHVYTYLVNSDDSKHAEKVLDLIEKLDHHQYMIGFAGHFSAGKSTLINEVLNVNVLPSSPIPTSANVVRLRSGEPRTVVYYHHQSPLQFDGELDLDTVKQYCKNGEEIRSLDIFTQLDSLPDHMMLLDTPGVDSTNEADRVITESFMHVMDHLCYVTDYNHVQSDVNLAFLKRLEHLQTPYSLIINQVDKHDESELNFSSFEARVRQTLQAWDIRPERIYFTSLKDKGLAINELSQLTTDILNSSQNDREADRIERQLSAILEASVDDYQARLEPEIDHHQDVMAKAQQTLDQYDSLETTQGEIQNLRQADEQLAQDMQKRAAGFINNAYIIPGQLREDAESYLQAMQPGFKKGRLFTQKKTEEERERRLNQFHTRLLSSIETNVKWPLRDRLIDVMNMYSIDDPVLLQDIQLMDLEYPAERLNTLIESGASVTGKYVLIYTEKLANDIRQYFKRYIHDLQKRMTNQLNEQVKDELRDYRAFIQANEEKQQSEAALADIEANVTRYRQELEAAAERSSFADELHQDVTTRIANRYATIQAAEAVQVKQDVKAKPQALREEPSLKANSTAPCSADRVMAQVDEVSTFARELPGTETIIEQLIAKRERLADRSFTVALFGAFSAGKSSFANALLGDHILPVSPNPTTAAINKISPVDEQNSHGSVRVVMKSSDQLKDDITSILQNVVAASKLPTELTELIEWLNNGVHDTLNDEKQASFLHAVSNGYEHVKQDIGTEITIPLARFAAYVSNEEIACFVEEMVVYYDCEWTRQGITLVDTPGADSANARHTDVAFDYIKDADAILFVTYYNHPFSRADQSFLTQLGRVKDVFSMDKMFFILNAADLSSSGEELNEVTAYLTDQLAGFHIMNPRIFPVSSKSAINGARASSGLASFEKNFTYFIKHELAEVIIESIHHDMQQLNHLLTMLQESASLSERDKQSRLDHFESALRQAADEIDRVDSAAYKRALEQKVKKQMYYVHDRMMLNMPSYFKHHFNPASINGKGKEASEQLRHALDGFLSELNHELYQECQAVTLRVESYLDHVISSLKEELESKLNDIDEHIYLVEPGLSSVHIPSFHILVELSNADWKQAVKWFKGTHAFFEKNEKENMKDQLSTQVDPKMSEELQKAEDDLQRLFMQQWEKMWEDQLKGQWKRNVEDTLQAAKDSVVNPYDMNKLAIVQQKMQTMLDEKS